MAPHMLTWSVLNFLGIVMETLAKAIWNNEVYQYFEKSILSPRGQRRFHAAISAPLFLLSIASNMYFLLGEEIGNVVISKGFTPTVLFFMYCGAQTSIEIKNWEIMNKM